MSQENNLFNFRSILVFLVGLSLGFFLTQFYVYRQKTSHYLTMADLTKRVTDYVDKEMFRGKVHVKVTEMEPYGGVAKFKIEIPGQGSGYTSYVTRDGRLLFPQGYEIKFSSQPTPTPTAKQQMKKQGQKQVTPTETKQLKNKK